MHDKQKIEFLNVDIIARLSIYSLATCLKPLVNRVLRSRYYYLKLVNVSQSCVQYDIVSVCACNIVDYFLLGILFGIQQVCGNISMMFKPSEPL